MNKDLVPIINDQSSTQKTSKLINTINYNDRIQKNKEIFDTVILLN